jgi:hypothetical protein
MRLVQGASSSEDRVIALRSAESTVQQEDLEDLGMCFMMGTLNEGWVNEGVGEA